MAFRRTLGASAIFLLCAACATRSDNGFDQLNAIRAEYNQPLLTKALFAEQKRRALRFASEHERMRLRGAGFARAGDIARSGRTQVRATFTEPRLFVRMPGVTLESTGTGAKASLTSDGRAKIGSGIVSRQAFEDLRALEAAAFASDPPLEPTRWRKGDPIPEPPPVCHGWGTTIERITPGGVGKVEAHGCNHGATNAARLLYGTRLAETALTGFPDCVPADPNASAFERLAKCFGTFDPATTANP